jgi:hypothetical protein
MNDAAGCCAPVVLEAPFRVKKAGGTSEWAVTTPAVKGLGRPAFFQLYRWAACSVTSWKVQLVAVVGRKTTGLFLVAFAKRSKGGLRMPYIQVGCYNPRQEAPGLKSTYLHLATFLPWDLGSRQIHENFRVTFFAENIRALNASFESNVAYVRDPYFGNSAYK